jgi:hypothetical protein
MTLVAGGLDRVAALVLAGDGQRLDERVGAVLGDLLDDVGVELGLGADVDLGPPAAARSSSMAAMILLDRGVGEVEASRTTSSVASWQPPSTMMIASRCRRSRG